VIDPTTPIEGDRADRDDEVPSACEICGRRWCECSWPGAFDGPRPGHEINGLFMEAMRTKLVALFGELPGMWTAGENVYGFDVTVGTLFAAPLITTSRQAGYAIATRHASEHPADLERIRAEWDAEMRADGIAWDDEEVAA